MDDRIVGKLGKLDPKRPAGLHQLAFYQGSPLPVAPDTVAVPNVDNWGILGNDTHGDCTFAGIVHARMANAAFLGITETFPSDTDVVNAYLSYTGGADAGAVEADLLKFWQGNGLFGSKLSAFAPTDHADLDELRSVIANFGLAYIGVQCRRLRGNGFKATWKRAGLSLLQKLFKRVLTAICASRTLLLT